MSLPRRFTGQLPLMQVSQQPPQENHDQARDQTTFRWNSLTFAEGRSSTLPARSQNVTFPPPAVNDASIVTPRSYQQIRFSTARIRGQKPPDDATNSAEKPKRKRKRVTKHPEKPRLKAFKPLSASSDMHADAWSIILAHTRPAFVMQMRTVSKFFYHITNMDTIWRNAREYHFGADVPACPSFLTERQYANLLDGRGCQNPQCERRETRKVRWVFRLRLCDDCLSRKLELYKHDTASSPQSHYTSLFQTTAERDQFGTSVIDLLPTSGIWSGKPSAPRRITEDTGKWQTRYSSVSPLLYLKSEYLELEAQYQRMQEEEWDPQRIFEWVREKYQHATMIARVASELEKWDKKIQDDATYNPIREQRRHFFIKKASKLTPHMSDGVLSRFAAYQNSLASPNPPTERAWETLLAKILPYRAQAEMVARHWGSRYARYIPSNTPSPETALFDKLHQHRRTKRKDTGKWLPEQQFVLDLAGIEFTKLLDTVADEDLVLLCLRNVYETYQNTPNKPQGMNVDGTTGEYRLSLDDAKLIVEEIIEKEIKKSTLRGVKVFESFKCMGCTRFISGKRFSFQSAFDHMLEKHAPYVGKDLHFHRFLKPFRIPPECVSKDYKFPWYLIEWTRSLPLLPRHAEITSETRWDPGEDAPYVKLNTFYTESAFEGRRVVPSGDVSPDDFVSNFVYAAKTLSTTRLNAECVVKIAVRYGTDLAPDSSPSIDDFFACIKPTQRLPNSLQFKFRCGACNRRPDVNSHLRCVKHAVDVEVLRKHWDDKHARENLDWTNHFMHLPSDDELLGIILAQDEQLKHDQEASIEREIFGLRKSAKKLRDQKVGALMRKETAISAFSRLFAKV